MKKSRKYIVLSLLAGFILSVCTAGGCSNGFLQMEKLSKGLKPVEMNDKYGTTYEIFVRSFYDSDGDGIGDLKGVEEKLDYLSRDKGLGVDGIWLMPVNKSTTYHKYDVTDYMDIDPEYGDLSDMENLIAAAHDKNIKIYMDLVMNHSSDKHDWFVKAAEYLKSHPGIDFSGTENVAMVGDGVTRVVYGTDGAYDLSESFCKAISECPYVGYYNFSDKKAVGYEALPGTDYYYEARFWSGMPDLNLANQKVRDEFDRIVSFWLGKGVDGFRLDAAKEYKTGSTSYNVATLDWFNTMVKGKNTDAYIVAEVWSSLPEYAQYYESGIDSCFDFAFADADGLITGLARGNKGMNHYGKSLQNVEKVLKEHNPDAVDAPFYTNHDMNRSAGYYSGEDSTAPVKFAEGLNLMMQGNAFIYYGEELGMRGSGKDETKRLPMVWGQPDSEGMTNAPSGAEKVNEQCRSLEEQIKDPSSVYNYIKTAVKIREAFPVIARGDSVMDSELSDDKVCVLDKIMPDKLPGGMAKDSRDYQNVRLVFNNSKESQTAKCSGKILAVLLCSDEKAVMDEKAGELSIPSYGIVVLSSDD